MRVAPRAAISVAVLVGYMVVVSAVWWINDVDYATIGDTVGNVVVGIVVPVGLGAVLTAGVTSYLGWWRPSLREDRRAGGRWLLLVPILLALTALGVMLSGDVGSLAANHLLVLALGTLLVGFSEEMLCRGLGLVGFRGSLSEVWAWLATAISFGVLHAVNALFGQGLGQTLQQMAFAFVAGTAFYVIRRATGLLIWCMLLHAFWDFSTLSADASGVDTGSPWAILGVLQYVAYVLAFVGLWLMLRGARTTRVAPQTV